MEPCHYRVAVGDLLACTHSQVHLLNDRVLPHHCQPNCYGLQVPCESPRRLPSRDELLAEVHSPVVNDVVPIISHHGPPVCPHRSAESYETVPTQLCGMCDGKEPVYQCALHQARCVTREISTRRHPDLRVCLKCDDNPIYAELMRR